MKQIKIIEQLDLTNYTFYDVGTHSILQEFEGFEFAEIRNSIDNVAGDYGAVYVNSKMGRRRVAIRGDLIGADVYNQRRLLARALRQTGTIKLFQFITYDDLELQFEAEITKVLNPYTHKIHTFLIEATAPDWRFYSQTLHSQDIAQTIIRGGAMIPFTIPLSIPEPTADEVELSNIITNVGNEQSDPVITLTGPGTGFTIGNVTADKELFLDVTLAEGDEVVIDVKARTVVKNVTTNLYPDLTGDFWSVLPGQNELRFLVNSGLSIDVTNLNIQFRDAYNGI